MINELYFYACPKLSENEKNRFNIFHVFCVVLFSSFILLIEDIAFGIAVMISYLVLSLLCFLDKDFKSRYLKLVMLCVLDISVVSTHVLAKLFYDYPVIFLVIISGIIFSMSYEILFFIRIRKKLYSNPSKNKKSTYSVTASSVLLSTMIFRIINKNSPNLAVMIMVFLCAGMVLASIISLQQLIIYLLTKNKIQVNSENVKATDDAD